MITEVLKTTKITQSKVFIGKKILSRIGFKDGDLVMWCLNKEGELILKKTETSDIF
ncbi:hypothetical protein LCGC14_0223550 [marine sediment metagenome]|uniref:SpoVT-AbrB domain-containing protein n=1 Tax=marine sediment metagenome TaxID=412755 RepID=A0A0F9UTH8_9ZZZZ